MFYNKLQNAAVCVAAVCVTCVLDMIILFYTWRFASIIYRDLRYSFGTCIKKYVTYKIEAKSVQ